jgi:hypothetical protein
LPCTKKGCHLRCASGEIMNHHQGKLKNQRNYKLGEIRNWWKLRIRISAGMQFTRGQDRKGNSVVGNGTFSPCSVPWGEEPIWS